MPRDISLGKQKASLAFRELVGHIVKTLPYSETNTSVFWKADTQNKEVLFSEGRNQPTSSHHCAYFGALKHDSRKGDKDTSIGGTQSLAKIIGPE